MHRLFPRVKSRLSTRMTLFVTGFAAWQPLLWVAAAVIAGLMLPLRYAIGQNSDGLLTTLISLQHLTLFFWEQDRFANLLPWLTSWIADPTANARGQLALRIGLGVAAPLLFCAAAGGDYRHACRATLLATALALAFAPERFLHEWFIEANPYGTSFALAGFALLLFSAAATAPRGQALALRLAGAVLTVVAYAVNISLVLISAPLFAMQVLLFRSFLALDFAIASAIAGLGTALTIKIVRPGGTPTSARFGETMIGVTHYAGQMLGKPGLFLAAMAATFLAAVLITKTVRHTSDRTFIRIGAVLLGTFVIGFFEIALSSWVVLNLLHPRYLVPLYILMSALGAMSLLAIIGRVVDRPSIRSALALALCVVLLVAAGRRSLSRVPPGNPVIDVAFRPVATSVADAVTQRRLDGVAGDYWNVWPSVFLAEQQAHDLGRPPGHVFGVALRGNARREAFRAHLAAQGRLDIACIDLADDTCRDLVNKVVGEPSLTAVALSPPTPMADDHTLSILRLTRSAAQ